VSISRLASPNTAARGILGTIHDAASMRVVQPLLRVSRLARPSQRAAMLAFNRGMRFRTGTMRWPAEQKRDWILRQLRHAVRRAARETPYYRDQFVALGFDPVAEFDFRDFARLPVLERGDVHRAGPSLRTTVLSADQVRKDATGGSTGAPTEIWTGPEERGWRESGSEYYMHRVGLPSGTRIGLLWGHHLDPVQRRGVRDWLHDWADNVRWFDCLRLSPDMLEGYHRELQQWRPHGVVAYASALAALAEQVHRPALQPSYPSRCFVTGAEKLMPHERSIIEQTFHKPVHERYGSRDVGLIAFQTNPGSALDFEVDWCNVLVEPETEGPDSPILVTKLHADAMPMLRYRIGDIGRFPEGSGPGQPALTLQDILGRTADRIWLPNGRWAHGLGFPHLMKDYPVREFQVVQRRDFSVEVRVVPRGPLTDASREGILQLMRANLVGLPVSLLVVDDIPKTRANKRRPVISELESQPDGAGRDLLS